MPADQIMREFYAGTLKSGSGQKVTSLAQAKAIAASYGKKGDKEMKESKTSKGLEAAKKVLSGGAAGQSPTANDVMPRKPKKPVTTREMRIRRGSSGGFIATHIMEDEDGMEHPSRPEHVISSRNKLKKHIDQHFPQGSGEMDESEDPENC